MSKTNTSVNEIKVETTLNGSYRLIDTERNLAGEWVSYKGIAQLEMPADLQLDYGKDARWIWCSEYWKGYFPTEQLLVLCKYE